VRPGDLIGNAPGPGWGVVAVAAEVLRELGFDVIDDPDPADSILGAFHVSATPPGYDADGQIPLDLRARIASLATVAIAPEQD
jgi:hypothetical protein